MKAATLPVCFVMVFTSEPSDAAIAKYGFNELGLCSSDDDPQSMASDFSLSGKDLTACGISDGMNAFYHCSGMSMTSEGALKDPGTFFGFTISPVLGAAYTFTSLTLSFGGNNDSLEGDGNDFTGSLFLRTSLDGYSSNVDVEIESTHQAGSILTYVPVDLDLSSLPDDLTEPVTFRLYMYGSTEDYDHIVRMDDVILWGDVRAVPEPGIAALVLQAFGLALLWRTRGISD